MRSACCLLPAACCLLLAACCWLLAACCLLLLLAACRVATPSIALQSPLCGLCLPRGAIFLPPGVVARRITVCRCHEFCAWGGMHNPQSSSILEHAVSVVELARPLVESVQRKDRDLASQIRRAISSIALNASEGFATVGGNARLRFETALGSLHEARTAIRVAVAWGYVRSDAVSALIESLNSLGGRIFGLTRR